MRSIETTDEAGNKWSLNIVRREPYTNRFKFIFSINNKEFLLHKITTHKQANDLWDSIKKMIIPGTKIIEEIIPDTIKEGKIKPKTAEPAVEPIIEQSVDENIQVVKKIRVRKKTSEPTVKAEPEPVVKSKKILIRRRR